MSAHPKKKSFYRKKQQKKATEKEEIAQLERECQNIIEVQVFSELPLSQKTQQGLEKANYVKLTDIQSKSIPLALKKRDVLGAAKTGSLSTNP